jgi:hypothetical protein
MQAHVVDGVLVIVVPDLDGAPGGRVGEAIVIEDSGDHALNMALARAIAMAITF